VFEICLQNYIHMLVQLFVGGGGRGDLEMSEVAANPVRVVGSCRISRNRPNLVTRVSL
jgi:hypothetical protein